MVERADSGLRIWRLPLAALLGLGLALAVRDSGSPPLEYHEAYVVESAQEMGERGSWFLPFFNGEPRLRKPPLSYWATALSGGLAGHDRLQPGDGRLPSALAGFGILTLVVWMGARTYDRKTALLAGLMLVSSLGYFHYTHSARSDMLYSFWAMAGLAAFLSASWRAERGRSTWPPAAAMWFCFALATLTKGPQVPAMFLVAFGAWAAIEGVGWRQTLSRIRPFSGLVILLALTVPWWLAVEREAGAGGVAQSQLGGSLLRPGGLAVDYLYRLPQLLIPWAVLLPTVVLLEWRDREKGKTTRLLGAVVGVTVVAFSLGSQQRTFYVLPIVGPAVLLLAAGTSRVLAAESSHARLRRLVEWTGRGWMLAALMALLALLSVVRGLPDPPPGITLRIVLTTLLALAGCALLFTSRRAEWNGTASIVALAALAYGGFWILGGPVLEWTRSRTGAERFGRLAAASTPAGREILAWDTFPDPFVYYAERPIRELTTVEEVLGELGSSPGGLVVLAKTSALRELPAEVGVEVLHRQLSYRDRDVALVRLSRASPGEDLEAPDGRPSQAASPAGVVRVY